MIFVFLSKNVLTCISYLLLFTDDKLSDLKSVSLATNSRAGNHK